MSGLWAGLLLTGTDLYLSSWTARGPEDWSLVGWYLLAAVVSFLALFTLGAMCAAVAAKGAILAVGWLTGLAGAAVGIAVVVVARSGAPQPHLFSSAVLPAAFAWLFVLLLVPFVPGYLLGAFVARSRYRPSA